MTPMESDATLLYTVVGEVIATIWMGRWVVRRDVVYPQLLSAIAMLEATSRRLEELDMGTFFPLVHRLDHCAERLTILRRETVRACTHSHTADVELLSDAIQYANTALDEAEDELRIWYVDLAVRQPAVEPAPSDTGSVEESLIAAIRKVQAEKAQVPTSLETVYGIYPDEKVMDAIRMYNLFRYDASDGVEISDELLSATEPIKAETGGCIRVIPHFRDMAEEQEEG